jgi:hypothetical protein
MMLSKLSVSTKTFLLLTIAFVGRYEIQCVHSFSVVTTTTCKRIVPTTTFQSPTMVVRRQPTNDYQFPMQQNQQQQQHQRSTISITKSSRRTVSLEMTVTKDSNKPLFPFPELVRTTHMRKDIRHTICSQLMCSNRKYSSTTKSSYAIFVTLCSTRKNGFVLGVNFLRHYYLLTFQYFRKY